MHANVLTYSDVQTWLKRVRNVTKMRFFVCGEYGHAKGRAHWHVVAFWKERLPPNYREGVRYLHEGYPYKADEADAAKRHQKLWDHGWTFWQAAEPNSIRYAVKYVLKDTGRADLQNQFGMSCQPPLGSEYFRLLAWRHVDQGLSPQDLRYSFEECRLKDGSLIEYRLIGASAFRYLAAFAAKWREVHGDDRWPQSDLMDAWVDECARRERRRLGVADYDDLTFDARFELARREKWRQGGTTGSVATVSEGLWRAYPDRYPDGKYPELDQLVSGSPSQS